MNLFIFLCLGVMGPSELTGFSNRVTGPDAESTLKAGQENGRGRFTETHYSILVKSFCVEMRRHHKSGNNQEFRRQYIDPAYLQENELDVKNLRIQMVPVTSIHNLRLSDDRKTCIAHVSTTEKKEEILMFSVVPKENQLYIRPQSPPDQKTKEFRPWSMRMQLTTR